ncbi:MAG: diphthine--ammonia ligase [Candidatus ainarchaeum sp.]|nr:diphthine--ammonia ligase [Candidatus ainarchaeum sp.]
MCGIAGIINKKDEKTVKEMLLVLKHRGPDSSKVVSWNNSTFGQNLLAIVENIPQPISDKEAILAANCEIYNWEELNKKYKLGAKNDAELLFKLLKKKNIDAIKELDGDYAFVYADKNIALLARDFFGLKPIWYSNTKKGFYFASEKKALPKFAQETAQDLHPRNILEYNLKTKKTNTHFIDFYKELTCKVNLGKEKQDIKALLEQAVKKRVNTNKKIGILLSGGVDSSIITAIAKKYNKNITCYVASAITKSEDEKYAEIVAKHLGLKLKKIIATEKEILKALPEIIKILETSDPVKIGVALPFYFCTKEAKKDGIKVMLSGLGSEDVFIGYDRYTSNKDGLYGLKNIFHRDLYRDDLICMNNSIELRVPLLDKELVKYAINIDIKHKIKDKIKKYILREIASDYLPKEIAFRARKAAQFSSGFDKAITKLAKGELKQKGEYYKKYISKNNDNVGILFTGGKDSVLTLEILKSMNYDIKCLITIDSKNKDSYMYHTPNISLAKLQAKALEIPIIVLKTKGEKELELKELEKAIKIAKEKYNINSIASGAIFSEYQRDRIEIITEKLGLKCLAPLWHKNQEQEVNELISRGIKAIITKICAHGLTQEDLGKEIDKKMLEKLKKINEKLGFNIAGEGGEYESFVLDSPSFKKKVEIVKSTKHSEGEYNHNLSIEKLELKKK